MGTQSGTRLPESVADTPDTEDLPAGEALHLGIPLRWTTLNNGNSCSGSDDTEI